MPLVKLTIKHEPVDVDEDEVENLRQQGLLESVLDEPAPEVPPKNGKPATPPADAGKTEEQ